MNSERGVGGTAESGTGESGAPRDAPRGAGAGDDAGAVADGGAAEANADAGGYVHRPDAAGSPTDAHPDAESDVAATTTGLRGWVLVGVVVTCFLVIPGVVYLRPAVPGQFGLSFFATMLVLPLVPAVLLGLTAVWSMRGPRDPDRDGER